MPKNVTIREAIVISRPPEAVWDFTQDYARRTLWDRTVLGAEELQRAPRVVKVRGAGGLVFIARYKQEDRPRRTSLAMTDVQSRIVVGGGGSWEYRAVDGGTELVQTNTLALASAVGWLFAPLVRWRLRAETRRALRKAKELLERDGGETK